MSAEPVVHTLLHPVELKNASGEVLETVREVQLHRLNGGAARKVLNAQAKGAGDFAFVLICESARMAPSTFDKLDAEDVLILMDKAAPFLGSAPATSRT